MKLPHYMTDAISNVTITFLGSKPASVKGTIIDYDEHHIILVADGEENYIPWTAVGMVTNHSKKI